MSTLVKLVAAIIAFTIAVMTAMIVMRHHGKGADKEPSNEIEVHTPVKTPQEEMVKIKSLHEKFQSKNYPEIIHGNKAFEKARQLLRENKWEEAETKLNDIINRYENTPSALAAYKVLGEMKLDEVFSVLPNDGKINYKVKSGDSYFKIASDHKTNLDLLMLLNGLTRLDKLRPKDELILMPLDFKLRIVPAENQLFLMKGEEIIQYYKPVKPMVIPKRDGIIIAHVKNVDARNNGIRVNPTRGGYRESEKRILVDNPQIEIRVDDGSVPEDFRGILLTEKDIEELSLLLRRSNVVEIRY